MLREGGSQKTGERDQANPDQRQDSQAERQEAMNNCPAMAWRSLRAAIKRCAVDPRLRWVIRQKRCPAAPAPRWSA